MDMGHTDMGHTRDFFLSCSFWLSPNLPLHQTSERDVSPLLPVPLGLPARQAALKGGIPLTVPSTAINKACPSGLNAIALSHRQIAVGEAELCVAGGMEGLRMLNRKFRFFLLRNGFFRRG